MQVFESLSRLTRHVLHHNHVQKASAVDRKNLSFEFRNFLLAHAAQMKDNIAFASQSEDAVCKHTLLTPLLSCSKPLRLTILTASPLRNRQIILLLGPKHRRRSRSLRLLLRLGLLLGLTNHRSRERNVRHPY